MQINSDGSVQGQTFSGEKYKGEYPRPKHGKETYASYHKRVNECVKNGFHKGDLGWSDYQTYCMGSGQFEGADAYEII